MEDFEKFDKLVNDFERGESSDDGDLDNYLRIVRSLKNNQPHPSISARSKSQRLMLEEAGQLSQKKREKRLVNLGRLLGLAVPALLIFAVLSTVLTSRGQSNGIEAPAIPQGASGEEKGTDGVLEPVQDGPEQNEENISTEVMEEIEPAASITPTRITNEGTASEPISGQVEEGVSESDEDLAGESINSGSQITVPDGDGGQIVIPEPQIPLPGARLQPPIGGSEGEMVTPRPGDGREDGRNPDS
ncbi:MAG: hypothetical protein AAF902_00245 [Chloroflexota bacterium]